MSYNLFINYYTDKNEARMKELDFCLITNIENFDKVIIIVNQQDLKKLLSLLSPRFLSFGNGNKINYFIHEARPTFNDYFKMISWSYSDNNNINIIANSDIIIPKETLTGAIEYLNGNTCLALTRWDSISTEDYTSAMFFNNQDSQDSWFFRGAATIKNAPFGLGIAGCDNAIAHIIDRNGYNIINPSRLLKTYHIHLSGIRNYRSDVAAPKPYKKLIIQ